MALIQRGMYEQFAARHLAVKGSGALTNIEEGVMGVLPLDISSDPVYWFIQGIRTYSKHFYEAGVAGQKASVGLSLENEDATWLTRIIGIDVTLSSPATFTLRRCARTAYSSGPGVYGTGTDTRIPETQPSQTVGINGTHAVSPGTALQSYDTTLGVDQVLAASTPLILSPGQCIVIEHETIAATISAAFSWVEIPAYRTEL